MTEEDKLKDLHNKILIEHTGNSKVLEIEFNRLYEKLRVKHIKGGTYFTGAPIELYKNKIHDKITKINQKETGFSEVDLIEGEYRKYYSLIKSDENYPPIEPTFKKITLDCLLRILNDNNRNILTKTIDDRLIFLEMELYRRGYTLEEEHHEFGSSPKLILTKDSKRRNEYLLQKGDDYLLRKIKWKGNQTELMELIKALVENGTVTGLQKDIVKVFTSIFDIEIKHPDKLINDLKKRNNDSQTLFLDKLKTSLLNHLNKENIR